METIKLVAIILFAITYVCLLAFPKYRAYIALVVGFVFLCAGILPWNKFGSVINWNVLMVIIGTMGLISLFIDSKMPALLADILISKTPNVMWAIVVLSLFAGLISAFVDNVATVLMVAPVALSVTKKLNVNPVIPIISISISSNLQGVATLVGDTTSIMLAAEADMTFADFFVFQSKPGMFWVVQIGAIMATLVIVFALRKNKEKVHHEERTKVTDFFPSILLILMLVLLIVTSFIKDKPEETPGIICIGLMIVGIIYNCVKNKDAVGLFRTFLEIDFNTIFLLFGLFLIIGGITEVGVIDDLANAIVKLSGSNVFVLYTILVWGSVLISAFVDNIPYVATMLPVVTGMAATLGISPIVLYFGLMSGATLGGNLTPIGASANVTAVGILRKAGYEVKTGTFMKMSVPFTLIAVACGYGLVWLFYGI
ncbi:MAG: TRAP transporter large permease subunit [Clostridia bacterium]|nr:TRAP transporter large permease subunit [Clostridia bacterium]